MVRKRILFLTSSAGGYGGENALLDFLRNKTEEFEPIVLVPEQGPLVDSLTGLGIKTQIVPIANLDRKYFHPLRILIYKGSALLSIFRLVNVFRNLKPDIVHTNNVLVLPGAIAAKMLGIPHVWHVREIIEGHHIHPFLWRIWRWIILTFSARVICISSAVGRQFGESHKVVVIHDGVDTDAFHPMKRKPLRPVRDKKRLMIGCVGRLEHRRKGQDIFIEAARFATESRDDLHFVIVGHEREGIGEKEQGLRDTVRSYGLEKGIEFRGFVSRDQMPQLMNDLDILVLSSKQPEGLGIVLLEAMSCGKAVISFAEGGPLDIIKDHVNGLLTKPRDPRQLAEALVELANDPKLRRALGSEGRKTVENSFRSEVAAKKIAILYQEVLSERRGSAFR